MEKGLIFTLLLTYGGAIVSLFRPFYGLLIYICFSILRPETLWFWSVPPGNYSRIVAIALLAGWVLQGGANWNFGRSRGVLLALLGFWAWAIPSSFYSEYPELGWGFLETKGKIVLPFLVGLTLVDSRRQLLQLAWTIMLSQGYVAYELNRAYYDGFNRLAIIGAGGMDNNSAAIAMVCGVGLAFFLGLGTVSWWKKLLAFAAAGLMTHCVLFSESRGGMLGLIMVATTSFLILPKTFKNCGLFALGITLGLAMAGEGVRERFLSAFVSKEQRDASAESRVVMWGICIDMMLSSPVTGVGPDHFPVLIPRYSSFAHGKEAHTLWLQIAAELGVPGVTFLALFYFLACWHLWWFLRRHVSREGEDPFIRYVPQMVIAALSGFALSAQFVSLEGLELPYYVTLLGAGALKLVHLESFAAETSLDGFAEADSNLVLDDMAVDRSFHVPR